MADLLTESVADAVQALRSGGLVALPTETVYGLGADADNPAAVARMYAAKGRPADHPVIVHCASVDDLPDWAGTVPSWARLLVAECWPGPLTLVLPRSKRAGDHVTGGQDTVALRVPSHPIMREVLTDFGGAIAAPSANRFGSVSPTTAQHVLAELAGWLDPTRDRILDGGPCPIGVESTIVDATGELPRILRPGSITHDHIAHVTGLAGLAGPAAQSTIRSPGGLPRHYAPRAKVLLAEQSEAADLLKRVTGSGLWIRVGLIAPPGFSAESGTAVTRLSTPGDASEYAKNLYAALRLADEEGMDAVVAVLPADLGLGTAVRDRLRRAASGRFVRETS